MKKFETGEIVIAINDAPEISEEIQKKVGINKAYKKGDKFIVYRESIEDSSGFKLIIYHPLFEEISVNSENFKTISEYRDFILNNILKD